MKHRRMVCDIRELPDVSALKQWAAERGTVVHYLGPDLKCHAVYAAVVGPVIRVARSRYRDPHPHTLVWESPLENLPDAVAAV